MDQRERSDSHPPERSAAQEPACANRLAHESSPYLRAHAYNPVDWYPWGPEALERARRERKPILLSIGYAACHWCHVMAHESFEDRATAAAMNELYVNIKVDREERPDLDRLYQLSQHLLTGRSGGWPLTMFLMHDDQRPFFGGTYFPRESRFGLPAFREVLRQIAGYYHTHSDELRENAAQVVRALAELHTGRAAASEGQRAAELSDAPLRLCRAHLEQSFDREYGGFGAAPKFPHAPDLARLLHDWHASAHADVPDLQALYMTSLTLTRMAEGGLFDQLGGGFFRYSVDARWEIPHFEKMLYDNALLLGVYAQTAAATGEALFRAAATRTVAFLLRELASPEGALYSSLDADSDGHEGRFYVWQRDAVQRALPAHQWSVFAARFGLDGAPNFEGQWHLAVHASLEAIAERTQLAIDEVRTALDGAQQRLFELRAARVRPGLDDKILTGWNALAIAALALAARWLGLPECAAAATAALRYLRHVHWREGRLLAVSTTATNGAVGPAAVGASAVGPAAADPGVAAGRAHLPAYLDDYAFLIDAILELACVRFDAQELQWAVELAEMLLQHFEDREHGGFYFTADDHEALISRPKSFSDEAIPAGNAIAARALLRLGWLLGEPRYLTAAERTLRAAWPALSRHPEGHASMLLALEDYLDPPQIVLLRGPAAALEPWQRQLNAVFAPRRYTLAVPTDADNLPPAIAAKPAGHDAVAYLCRGTVCSAPISSLAALMAQLGGQNDAQGPGN
ncbi:MAG: thioredoxin domain-containing protein [Steroidobacteraceae bacterium]